MKPILKIKIAVDAAMSVSMLLLMAYGLVGEAAHEWIGTGMFVLFVAHHVLNRRWIQAVPRGRYTPLRIVQTALAGLISLCMVGSINTVEMAAHFLFTLSVIKRCNFRPIIWRRLQRFFIFKLLLLQFAYAPAKKMRDFKGNIPLTLGFQ